MRRDSLWKSPLSRIVLGVLYGLVYAAVGTFLLAALMLLTNIPAQVLLLSSDLLWGISAFMAGSRAGLHARVHGIRTGLHCGLLMCCILLAGCIVMGHAISLHLMIRCGILLLAGICGGIRGVNTKITKPPY